MPRLDALIDAIAPLALEAPVSGELALAHLPPTRRAGSKPFYIEGLNAESGDWEPPAAGQRYGELQAGVQLANRSGALNEIEYSEFVQKLQAFAEAVGAMADLPDMLEVVARARELDAFAGPHDAQLAVHAARARRGLVAWATSSSAPARQGFVPGAVPGRLVLPSAEEGAPPVLVLAFDPQAALADDPQAAARARSACSCSTCRRRPSAPSPSRPGTARRRRWPTTWTPTLVDDQGQPITLHAFAAIGAELRAALRGARGAATSPPARAAARRLFS